MHFLLTNDDGIDAAGLQALLEAAHPLGDVTVAAPTSVLSGCSHRVTTDQAFRVLPRGRGRFAIEGTPADCIRVGLHQLAPRTNWVLSGINHGGNLGADVWHSGTVAAAREAVLHGRPGIALSQYRKKGEDTDWRRTAAWVTPLLRSLLARPWSRGTFWNINLPHLAAEAPDPEIVFCRLDPTPLPLSFHTDGPWLRYNGDYHERGREPGMDVDVCFGGKIAVTELRLLG